MNKRAKINLLIIMIGVIAVIAVLNMSNGQNETSAKIGMAQAQDDILNWVEVKRERNDSAAIKRPRLYVTIMPSGEQGAATQGQLLATAKAAAIKIQKESSIPVVSVNMICQKAANAFGEPQLATAVYIPDGKGYNGQQSIGPWDMLAAAERSFTAQELEYLRLWAAMRDSHKLADGQTDEGALDKAISKKMGIEPESLNPHLNIVWPVK